MMFNDDDIENMSKQVEAENAQGADEEEEIEIQSSSSPSVKIASDRKSLCVAVTKDMDLCIDIRLPEQVNAINLQSQIQIVGGK